MRDEEKWDRFWRRGLSGWTPTRRNLFKRFSQIELPPGAKILDVGCGSGSLAYYWKSAGYEVMGLDSSEQALKLTREKGITCIKADVLKSIPFPDNTFDLVYSDGLLEHFLNPETILHEMFRASHRFVCTIVPRICLYNKIIGTIFKPPAEYKRRDTEWIRLHEGAKRKVLNAEKVDFGVLYILCEKSEQK